MTAASLPSAFAEVISVGPIEGNVPEVGASFPLVCDIGEAVSKALSTRTKTEIEQQELPVKSELPLWSSPLGQ